MRAARVSHRPGMDRPGSGPAVRQWERELQWGPTLDSQPRAAPTEWLALAQASPQRCRGPHPEATSGDGAALGCTSLGPAARPPGGAMCSGPWCYFIWTSYTYKSTAVVDYLGIEISFLHRPNSLPAYIFCKSLKRKKIQNFKKCFGILS